jgi:serine protease AprX
MSRVHDHSHTGNRFSVIPTPQRLKTGESATGKGITIAFIDAGFYRHPDIIQPENRILAYIDVTERAAALDDKKPPESWDWHGTQTCVAAVGNGFLSNGMYRGLAPDARVVLVKVSEAGSISEKNIARGLHWVIANKDRYNIRIVSISLGGDADVSYKQNAVDQLAEEAIRRGMIVVVAAGNSGCAELHRTVPPANAPSVITVGGYDDGNHLGSERLKLYCSSFGETADGFLKPEIIAPAMWVAAPILPQTTLYAKAEALSQLLNAPDYALSSVLNQCWKNSGFDESILTETNDSIRSIVESEIRNNKIISTHYQHVDGTSFAAPIVASLVAQMCEVNPSLTPAAIKHILISTSQRIANAPLLRQGYGMVNAVAALQEAAREKHFNEDLHFAPPRVERDRLIFSCHHDSAQMISLAGDFNSWSLESANLNKSEFGIWQISIPLPLPGRYRYKFVINGSGWIDDPSNGMKEPDGYGGFNSILNIL